MLNGLKHLLKNWLFGDTHPTVVTIEKPTIVEKHIHHNHYPTTDYISRQDGAEVPSTPFLNSIIN